MAREWDAAVYDEVSLPHRRWGAEVAARLPLAGGETVLDAGCGTGRVTEALLERLPRGTVVAVDASAEMLALAERNLARFGRRVRLVRADLTEPLPVDAPVDAVFSTATFHWITDHERLFANLAAILAPGGRLVAQCGGEGNIAGVLAALNRVRGEPDGTWRGKLFAGAQDTARRLRDAGFAEVRTWLEADPVPLERGGPLETYLATICLGGELELLPPAERTGFAAAVAAALDEPVVDYVRLNITARRG
ncbi:MAG: class I SAM-dependent methyltransferase [Acidimicrobiales bacterium]